MRSRGALFLLLLLLLLCAQAGCAGSLPSNELLRARVAMERARRSPTAERAKIELYEAEVALANAERAQQTGDRMAPVEAYVARRMADRARLAGLYAADQEAALLAQAAAARLQRDIAWRISAAAKDHMAPSLTAQPVRVPPVSARAPR